MVFKFIKPKIKEYIYIFPINKNEYQVRLGENDFIYRLKGKSVIYLSKLIPHLNGKNTIEAIAKKTKLRKKVVEKLIDKIKTFLIEGTTGSKKSLKQYGSQINFFSLCHKEPYKIQSLLVKSKICVINQGPLGIEVIKSLIASGVCHIYTIDNYSKFRDRELSHVNVHKKNFVIQYRPSTNFEKIFRQIDLMILCLDSFDPQFCDTINTFALEYEKPCFLIRKNGVNEGIVGPLIVPFLTACYKCLDLRIKANLDFYDEYLQFEKYLKNSRRKKPTPCLTALDKLLSSLAAIEIVKYITGFESPVTYSRFLVVNQKDFKFDLHNILKLPRCPSCGFKEDAFQMPWLEPIESIKNEQ